MQDNQLECRRNSSWLIILLEIKSRKVRKRINQWSSIAVWIRRETDDLQWIDLVRHVSLTHQETISLNHQNKWFLKIISFFNCRNQWQIAINFIKTNSHQLKILPVCRCSRWIASRILFHPIGNIPWDFLASILVLIPACLARFYHLAN